MGNRTAIFEKYDEVNEFASLGSQCTFCNILRNPITGNSSSSSSSESEKHKKIFLYEDDLCVIFKDIKNKATGHYQCIPKRHIKNYTRLRLTSKEETSVDGSKEMVESTDLQLLRHMERQGKQFLSEHHPDKNQLTETRMGFHGPKYNS